VRVCHCLWAAWNCSMRLQASQLIETITRKKSSQFCKRIARRIEQDFSQDCARDRHS